MHFKRNKQDDDIEEPELANRVVEDQVNGYLHFHDINSFAFLANHHSRKHCHTVCKQFIKSSSPEQWVWMVVWVKSDPENGISSLCVHSSDSLDVRMKSHIGCMSLNFPSVLLNHLFKLPVSEDAKSQ